MIKYVGPVVVYKIIDLHNYLLILLDGRKLQGLFEHERLKPAILRTSEGNVNKLAKLKQNINAGFVIWPFHVCECLSSYTQLTLVQYLTFRFWLSCSRDKLAVLYVAYLLFVY